MQQVSDILKKFKSDKDKYISKEFQKYGYDVAQELGDPKNTSMYIKLAKITPRAVMENAKNFVKDANNVKSKPALFLWKLKKLNKKLKDKNQGATMN